MISRVKENMLGGEVRLAEAPALVSFAFWAGLRCRGTCKPEFCNRRERKGGLWEKRGKNIFPTLGRNQ